MSHLGRWLSAQVDGELDGVERDRVLNHIAGCDACRQEANALRVLKRRMTALGDTVSDSAIVGRLIERARIDQGLVAGSAGPIAWPAHRRPAAMHATRRPWLSWQVAASSAGTALAAIGALAFMLGGTSVEHPAPRVSPAVDAYWKQHSYDTGQMPTNGANGRKTLVPAKVVPGPARHRSFAELMRLDAP
ncbi:MAG TPA: zf-HC2 domain-containing protein [Streptosporangiaceae bacterium]|nr:zf-HC2 domain-containing protein [Streptosporangiaceae bacterium]